MKGIYVAITFLAVSAASVVNSDQDFSEEVFWDRRDDVPTVCPLPDPNWRNTTTNIPHENNCVMFYKCNVGRRFAQICPFMIEGDLVTRLHYNRRLQVCDWPWQAGCASCPIQYPNGTFPPPERINNPSNDCQYLECANGHASGPFNCPPGTCFSRTCQECVRDRTDGNCNVVQPQPCIEGDRRLHDCYCNFYEECTRINGEFHWIQHECFGGIHFSVTEKRCMLPNEAKCPHIKHLL
ncbi:PREDICTED: uncharacterized protein LOC108745921 [Trachymyrmex septentrionalis]|nr:PREDICTED: uncharacterized protein LOC108745921 [Trachymyrmex septentrionalis]